MIGYYGYTLSPNQIETGEGFLICKNVPIARTGTMEYLASELNQPGDGRVLVYRSEDEVFNPVAVASFEGKPVTNDHPPDLVDVETCALYEKGHAQNVRRGTGEWKDFVLADLHIHDPGLIDLIKSGKREISCGYECDFDTIDGKVMQTNIRGNHIAVVEAGRAGEKAAIMDSYKNDTQGNKPERKKMKKKNVILKLLGIAAKDSSPEELETLVADVAEAMEDEDTPATDNDTAETTTDNDPEPTTDSGEITLDGLNAKMDKLFDMLQQKEQPKDEDPIKAAIDALEAKAADTGEVKTIEASEMDDDGEPSMDALTLFRAIRPSVAKIKDAKIRAEVANSIIKAVSTNDGDIKKIMDATAKNARSKAVKPDNTADIQKMYDSFNPHRKEN